MIMEITPEFVSQLCYSVFAGLCGGLFDLYMRDQIKRAKIVITMLVAIAMAYIVGNAICDYFNMRMSLCLLHQAMIAYSAIPILKGVRLIANGFAKNPIEFLKSFKITKRSDDEQVS